jgi:hypothetical protein
MPRAGIECEGLQTSQTHSMAQVVGSPQFPSALTALWMQRKEAPSPLTTTPKKQIHESEMLFNNITQEKANAGWNQYAWKKKETWEAT